MIRVGIDLQPIDEVAASIRDYGSRYTSRLFTADEVESCGTNPDAAATGFAECFAAKEAVFKILDTRDGVPRWIDIEVRRVDGGPQILLHGDAAVRARRQGISHVSLSISHAGGLATAAVIAQLCERAS